jgi:hypothetical protein
MSDTVDVFLWSLWNRDKTTSRRVLLIDRFVIVGFQPSLGEDYKYKLTALSDPAGARTYALGYTEGAEEDGYELAQEPLRWVRVAPRGDLWTWLSEQTHKDAHALYENALRFGTKLKALVTP